MINTRFLVLFYTFVLLGMTMLTSGCTCQNTETKTAKPAPQPALQPKMVPLETPEAQYKKGMAYLHGLGVAQDNVQAADWFRKAADRGHALAQYNLGAMYGWGSGMSSDTVQAMPWFQKAAALGITRAQVNIGLLYGNGDGVKKDLVEAKKWLQMAADKGDTDARAVLEQIKKDDKTVFVCPSMPKAKLCGPMEQAEATQGPSGANFETMSSGSNPYIKVEAFFPNLDKNAEYMATLVVEKDKLGSEGPIKHKTQSDVATVKAIVKEKLKGKFWVEAVFNNLKTNWPTGKYQVVFTLNGKKTYSTPLH